MQFSRLSNVQFHALFQTGLRGLLLASACLVLAINSGCASVDEKHYFRSTDAKGSTVNYFRLTVAGSAQGSRTRYLAGYLDEQAVNAYFGEHGVSSGDFVNPIKDSGEAKGGAKTERLHGLFGKNTDANKTFLMILSTNPKGVFDQIGSFVDSQVFAETLAISQNKDKFIELADLDAKSDNNSIRQKSFKTEFEALKTELENVNSKGKFEEVSLRMLSAIASFAGNPVQFKTLAEAEQAIKVMQAQFRDVK
jgi:hypothetical protein